MGIPCIKHEGQNHKLPKLSETIVRLKLLISNSKYTFCRRKDHQEKQSAQTPTGILTVVPAEDISHVQDHDHCNVPFESPQLLLLLFFFVYIQCFKPLCPFIASSSRHPSCCFRPSNLPSVGIKLQWPSISP